MRRLWVAVAIGAAALAGCGAAGTGDEAGEMSGAESAPIGQTEAGGGGQVGSAAPLELPAIGPSVIKTAELDVEVETFADATNGVTGIAARHGGFLLSSATEDADARRGTVAVRVPSDGFEAALAEIRGLGDVQRENVSGQDVGQEFVDLEARLRNLQAHQTVLLRLYDRAQSIDDTIRVQNELSGVQGQIEEIQGRLRYLRDQTAFGTITVGLAEAGAAAPGRFERAWDLATNALAATAAALIVVLGYLGPVALVVGPVVYLSVRRLRRPQEG